MSAIAAWRLVRENLQVTDLDEVLGIEQAAYAHPWTRGNFIDSIAAGHTVWGLREPLSGELLAYLVAQRVLDECHLLNLTVARAHWGRGIGADFLQALHTQERAQGVTRMFLEVRLSNDRAIALYHRLGYRDVGLRKGYYPDGDNAREDARVMRLDWGTLA